MVTSSVGSVVLVRFPFSDLSASKLRPALVLASAGREDWICVQITSNPYADPVAIELKESDFATGSLQRTSYIRPGKLFTAHQTILQRKMGEVSAKRFADVRAAVVTLINGKTASH